MWRCLLLLSAAIAGAVGSDENLMHMFPDPSWARPVQKNNTLLRSVRKNEADVCSETYSCTDCHTAQVCKPVLNGPGQILKSIKCPAERPWCDGGSCVTTQPERCGMQDQFICMKQNHKFPSSDCGQFHVCVDFNSVIFECTNPGLKYNPLTMKCESSEECGTFSCNGNIGRKVKHSLYPKYFAYCHENTDLLVVDVCPGKFELNELTQECEPICNRNGIIPDAIDCHKYYKCTQKYIQGMVYFDKEHISCPSGQFYSTEDYICVTEESAGSCSKAK